ncbi:putative flavin adenine dinucleotide transporter NDAI_0I00900 [Naumovozyma dairenensis CBS 421]|uniref:ML-like domain-containing protein n=1 Tax=Naumovozyma dairenensis (strain ATCC 10597 / BCRC 20456 / CBS 421 / NBRC 0211 / NRRL Y-12639) TaxID=1071378 RepID=G0WFU8_NAUDC|nr:hypothetical protein NDAI_0I00900 [Naumovozyma dairenensis CBS 421]CCD26659.1 hypothetical protein NDAI_0I00900 [Naumovozyma dairenensis CBS 421]
MTPKRNKFWNHNNPVSLRSILLYYVILLSTTVSAKRKLTATSLVTCMENSQLSANNFDVIFNPDDRSLHYTLDMTTQIDSYITADIDVYAYGFKIITKNVDLCNIDWKQFCPVHPGIIEIDSIEYISKEYVDEIPGIAYTVPDIDAYAKIKVYNNHSEYLACIQIFFSNGKTVSQTGVKWATAVVAGIGLLLSATLSTFGNSIAASHISANTMSLFLYFQSVVVIAMVHVHRVPPIAAAWSENLVWSMGLIKINFMQRIFRWYVESTGGTPDLYLTATTMSVLTQRSIEYLKSWPLFKRADNVLYGNQNTLIFRGIKRLAYSMGIENTSIVCTGFTFFVLCGYVLAGFIIVCKYSIELGIRVGWIKDRNKFSEFRSNWRLVLKGSLLRYVYIGFVQLTILSFWEFTERDSAAVIVIACLFIILSVGLMLWAAYRTVYFAKKSIQMYNNPAALLYGDQYVLHKYGFFYTMFNANHYWWNIVLLSYVFVKSLFIGFSQASGMTQALVIWLLDLFYFVAIIYYQPYLDKPTNIMNILIATVTVVNSFLFLFFSDLFGQSYKVSAIMGWIFFIMNAAFSFILLMMILLFTGLTVFSKNPDIRFKPAKDDRTSFQRTSLKPDGTIDRKEANELMALGVVANDHGQNWENELIQSNNGTTLGGKDLMFDEEKLDSPSSNSRFNRSSSTPENNNNSESNFNEEKSPSLFPAGLLRKLSFKNKKNPDAEHIDSLKRNNNIDTNNTSSAEFSSIADNDDDDNRDDIRPISPNRKEYPGLSHTRKQSDSQNGLIDSFDEEQDLQLRQPQQNIIESPFEDSNAYSTSPSINNINNSNMISKDSSIDTMPTTTNNNGTQPTDIFNNSSTYL